MLIEMNSTEVVMQLQKKQMQSINSLITDTKDHKH